jgi:two-component system, NarL family, nitrate/nitrite response regulator NarL
MTSSNQKKQIAASDNHNTPISEHETRLKLLLKQFANVAPRKLLQFTEQMLNEVIFESDVDGEYYYVVRCRPKPKDKVNLSPREIAIAKLVAQGMPNKLIGVNLQISPWTVATHLRRIFAKLDVTSRTAMIVRIFEEDLLQE